MPDTQTLKIQSLIHRIDNRLRKLIPARELYWDRNHKNYFIRAFDRSTPRLGPYPWTQLIGLARHVNAFRLQERYTVYSLQTPRGVYPEEPLRYTLKFDVVTPKLQAARALVQKAENEANPPTFPATEQGAADALAYAMGSKQATAKVTAPEVPAEPAEEPPVVYASGGHAETIDEEIQRMLAAPLEPVRHAPAVPAGPARVQLDDHEPDCNKNTHKFDEYTCDCSFGNCEPDEPVPQSGHRVPVCDDGPRHVDTGLVSHAGEDHEPECNMYTHRISDDGACDCSFADQFVPD